MNFMSWLKPFARKCGQFAVQNASHLLNGVGTVCSVSAVIFAVKSTPAAIWDIKAAGADKGDALGTSFYNEKGEFVHNIEKLTPMETIKACWKRYIPASIMEVLALTCFWTAHGIDMRRQAILSGLYATAEQALQEYQRQVQKTFGEKGDQSIREAIAQDTVNRLPAPPDSNPLPPGNTDRWCIISCGGITSPYFLSSYVKIKDAQNQINHEMIANMYATESDLYWLLDPDRRWLKTDGHSGQIGWTVDRLLTLDVTECDGPDHEPIYVVTYKDNDGCDYIPQPGFSKMY